MKLKTDEYLAGSLVDLSSIKIDVDASMSGAYNYVQRVRLNAAIARRSPIDWETVFYHTDKAFKAVMINSLKKE